MSINAAHRALLRRNYVEACNNYLEAFCSKHGFDCADSFWVASQPGTIAQIADYSVDMSVITASIDEDAPAEEFFRWYDYTLDALDLGLDTPNFHSWLHGCPRASREQIEKLRRLRQEFASETKKINPSCLTQL